MSQEFPVSYDLWLYIKLEEDGLASPDEFDVRGELEDALLDHDLEITGAGSGAGWMDISLKTTTPDETLAEVVDILSDYEMMHLSEINVSRSSHEDCNRIHTFQAGDALAFQFEDGDYGAALVISRGKDVLPWRDEALVGLLDYKSHEPPTKPIFEQRQWLITKRIWNQGQPYFVRLGGCGPEKFQVIDQIALVEDDRRRCQFHLEWRLLAEMIEIERQR